MTDDRQDPPASGDAKDQDGSTSAQDGTTSTAPPEDSTDWKAMAAKWERQANKDRADLVTLKKQVQGLLTPEQVADKTAALTQAQQEAATAAHDALRLRVALEKGLPADLADRLVGEDRAALEKDAATLLDLVGKKPPGRPSDASAGSGRQQPTPPAKPDPNALLRIMAGRA